MGKPGASLTFHDGTLFLWSVHLYKPSFSLLRLILEFFPARCQNPHVLTPSQRLLCDLGSDHSPAPPLSFLKQYCFGKEFSERNTSYPVVIV